MRATASRPCGVAPRRETLSACPSTIVALIVRSCSRSQPGTARCQARRRRVIVLIRRSSRRTDARSSCGEPLLSAGSACLAGAGRRSMVRGPDLRIRHTVPSRITLASRIRLPVSAAAERALSRACERLHQRRAGAPIGRPAVVSCDGVHALARADWSERHPRLILTPPPPLRRGRRILSARRGRGFRRLRLVGVVEPADFSVDCGKLRYPPYDAAAVEPVACAAGDPAVQRRIHNSRN